MGNSAMVVTMLLSLCVLTFIKARYCSTPYRTSIPIPRSIPSTVDPSARLLDTWRWRG